jgi:hypothetical protein
MKDIYGNGMRKSSSGEIKLSLLIPPLPPTNLNYSRVINTTYQLRIVAKVTGAHKNPVVNIPIRIGTIPLRTSLPTPHYNAVMNSSTTSQATAPPLENNDLAPPSYEEAMQIIPEMTGDDGHNVSLFVPHYPVWNFSPDSSFIQPSAPAVETLNQKKVPLN